MLAAKNLWFRYPSSSDWVLRGINLVVKAGEVVLVLGASGSGKTTLLRALTGIGTSVYGGEVRGEVELCGRRIEELTLGEIRRVIQVVNQNAYTHFIEHVVGADLYYSSAAIHGEDKGARVFNKVVNIFKLDNLLERMFFELSGGQLRRVAIAKTMLWDPRVVILDEPLMWLDDEGLEGVKEVVSTMRSLGKAVVVFEHRFIGLLPLANAIYLLKDGALLTLEHGQLRHPRKTSSHVLSALTDEWRVRSSNARTVLSVENVWFKYEKSSEWLLNGVNLSATGPGSTLVIFGKNGSGKSTLLKLIAGYLKPSMGKIKKAPNTKTLYLPQNIYLFFTEESLYRELEVTCSQLKAGGECVSRGLEAMRRSGMGSDPETSPYNLSWGQAVRAAVSIAASAGNDAVLLMDEPFTGLTYSERLSLAHLLARIDAVKIITVSNRETVSLIPGGRVYELIDGSLVSVKFDLDPEVLAAAEKCRELGITGAA